MNEQRKSLVESLRQAALTSPGTLDATTRQAAAAGILADADPAVAALVAKVHAQAWCITPADLEAVAAAGYSDEQVFELTVAASVGAGLHRLDVGLAAIAAASREP